MRKFVWSVSAAALTLAGFVALPGTASATTPVSGRLGIHGLGSKFVYNGVQVTHGSAGQAKNFNVQILNTGTTVSQYTVRVVDLSPPASGVPTIVKSGGTDITGISESDGGWVTPAIAPGQATNLTLTMSVPGGSPGQSAVSEATLYPVGGAGGPDVLGDVDAAVENTVAGPPTDHDLTVTSGFGNSTPGYDPATTFQNAVLSALVVSPGQTVTYSLNIRNNSHAAVFDVLTVLVGSTPTCFGNWGWQALYNGSDITSHLANGQPWTTPRITANMSVTVTVKIFTAGVDPACGAAELESSFDAASAASPANVNDVQALTSTNQL
jgi:hypothetical protein